MKNDIITVMGKKEDIGQLIFIAAKGSFTASFCDLAVKLYWITS